MSVLLDITPSKGAHLAERAYGWIQVFQNPQIFSQLGNGFSFFSRHKQNRIIAWERFGQPIFQNFETQPLTMQGQLSGKRFVFMRTIRVTDLLPAPPPTGLCPAPK